MRFYDDVMFLPIYKKNDPQCLAQNLVWPLTFHQNRNRFKMDQHTKLTLCLRKCRNLLEFCEGVLKVGPTVYKEALDNFTLK